MNVLIPLFSPPTGTWGSLTRVMALAKKFEKEGHSVAFCASGYVRETLTGRGFRTFEIPETTMLGLPPFLSNRLVKKSQQRTPPIKEGKSFGNVWLLYAFTGYAKKKTLAQIVGAEMEAAEDFKADLFLTEMELGAYIASYILKKPLVTTYSKISLEGRGTFFWKKIRKVIEKTLDRFGIKEKIDPEDLAFGPRNLKLVPSVPELDTTDPRREDICYTGNILEPIKAEGKGFFPEENKKYIFCYFGTGSVSLDTVVKVLPRALKSMGNVVCYVASQSIVESYAIGNVNFVRYIQAKDILPHCVLTMCHGGLNTVTQSLEAGVPLLIFPGAVFERRFNARQVQSAGCGCWGEASDFTEEWIRDKVKRIDELGKGVLQIRKTFREYRGADTAYECIKKWLTERLPMDER